MLTARRGSELPLVYRPMLAPHRVLAVLVLVPNTHLALPPPGFQDGSLKQCEEPFTLITPHICSNLKKTEGRLRKGRGTGKRRGNEGEAEEGHGEGEK